MYAFDNIVSRFRDRKRGANVVLCGSDCYVDAQARSNIKSPFDTDVVCGLDSMEYILDYAFGRLGIDTERIDHPILMTETLCNPEYSRAQMNELLFEAYQVPLVNYGLDALFSAYSNGIRDDGLVVSSGHSSTLVMPLVATRGVLENAKRQSWGGAQAVDFLQRLLQLKYPNCPQKITTYEVQRMIEELCYTSSDYDAEIRRFQLPENMAEADRVVQLPYSALERKEKTQEEIEKAEERKRAASRRLQEQTRLMRQEKAQQNENDLKYYTLLREWKEKEAPEDYLARLESEGFDSEQEFERFYKRLDTSVRKNRAEELGEEFHEEKKEPEFPLADVPDADLDEEGLKEKRRQLLLKAGYEARMRARAEKEEEKRLEAEREAKEQEERRENPEAWLKKIHTQYDQTLARIHERKRLREMLPNRKSAAAQQRMKSITALASENEVSSSGSQRRRKRGEDEDTFGADDSDWAVYRTINDATNEEEEAEDHAQLEQLEQKLLEFDDQFTEEDTYEALLRRKTRLTNTFLRGFEPKWDPEDAIQFHQLHLNVERIRVPEVSWQPLMAGIDQAGVGELCRHVLYSFDETIRGRMLQNVLVTGGYSQLPGFDTRLQATLRSVLPPSAPLSVRRAANPRWDAWRGMRQWVLEQDEVFRGTSVTRADYDEKGPGWFQEHGLSACVTK
ncbi:Nuclear actin-protein involved in chromatin remodeling [Malassezia nana]|uniref:Nuclear actin-protein involved in chromatin remodeling n=1 Tax=Malassezia nana TaxID=180528 RepID=A0AAF0EJ87_9BASI|nr:Nuclear actin-protein involved in chromatin remodeling [Malassezia nana]